MCTCSPATIFSWTATILINIAFSFLVSWGASTNWRLGFVLSAVYTVFLFFLAAWLQFRFQRAKGDNTEPDVNASHADPDESGETSVAGANILTSLLFLLGCLAVGVTGSFIPVNLISCTSSTSSRSEPNLILGSDISDASCVRIVAVVCLFVVALPVLVVSIMLYVKRGVPSMCISAYLGMTGIVCFLAFIIAPTQVVLLVVLKWWWLLSSIAWLAILTMSFLTNRSSKSLFVWSFSFSSLVFFVAMILLYQVPGAKDDAWRWILITLTSFIPLIIIGLVTNQFFSIFLGAVGFLIDSYKLAAFFGGRAGANLRIPIICIVLATAGAALGFLGFALNRQQKRIQSAVSTWAGNHLEKFQKKQELGDAGFTGDDRTEYTENIPELAEGGDDFVHTGKQM